MDSRRASSGMLSGGAILMHSPDRPYGRKHQHPFMQAGDVNLQSHLGVGSLRARLDHLGSPPPDPLPCTHPRTSACFC
jgi:hypothetical protein